MKKILPVLLIAVPWAMLSGCSTMQSNGSSAETSKPNYIWVSREYTEKYKSGKMTMDEMGGIYRKDMAACKTEALKIPIPAPSCRYMPQQDCSGMTGFALGMCQGQNSNPVQNCDHSAVNQAWLDRNSVIDSCMISKGWEKKYE